MQINKDDVSWVLGLLNDGFIGLTSTGNTSNDKRVSSIVKAALESCLDDGWKPIETAPKEVEIIVTNGIDTFVGCLDEDRKCDCYTTGDYIPIHWRPLPEKPTAKE